ncbi:unnamed protein product [Rhizoctonia solani]|uniref:Laminin domain protein n=1 Tax=Rhizoctonia solani TaxID=456999 RepID=A0A8H3AMG4_9AGAM|nr:unnamed protein product [Rhizoctonia solani]
MAKVQDAVLTYQDMRRFPSMFDAHVNMELSQHLFDLQMARHMRLAGETQPTVAPEMIAEASKTHPNKAEAPGKSKESETARNNAGTGAQVTETRRTSQSVIGVDVRDLMERSNQLADRFNQLMERSNELVERYGQPADKCDSPTVAEKLSQVLERLVQMTERLQQPAEQSNQLAERFSQLFERFNQLVEQSNRPAQKANELAEQSNNLADRANQLAEKLNQSCDRSNELSEAANESIENVGGLLKNISRVLAAVQHAIIRNHKGNTINAINCLVNDKGEMPVLMDPECRSTVEQISGCVETQDCSVTIMSVPQTLRIPNVWLADFLRFYGICDDLCESTGIIALKEGKDDEARSRLSDYLSSCLG